MYITTNLHNCTEEEFVNYLHHSGFTALLLNCFGIYESVSDLLERSTDVDRTLGEVRNGLWETILRMRAEKHEWINNYGVIQLVTCSRCATEALGNEQVSALFGYNKRGTKTYPQSYCYQCRRAERRRSYGHEKVCDERGAFVQKSFSGMDHLFTENQCSLSK